MVRPYTPEAGDIVWLHFDPQAGHEQAGHRPALVVSPSAVTGNSAASFRAHWVTAQNAVLGSTVSAAG